MQWTHLETYADEAKIRTFVGISIYRPICAKEMTLIGWPYVIYIYIRSLVITPHWLTYAGNCSHLMIDIDRCMHADIRQATLASIMGYNIWQYIRPQYRTCMPQVSCIKACTAMTSPLKIPHRCSSLRCMPFMHESLFWRSFWVNELNRICIVFKAII